jgi:hypothetical protein
MSEHAKTCKKITARGTTPIKQKSSAKLEIPPMAHHVTAFSPSAQRCLVHPSQHLKVAKIPSQKIWYAFIIDDEYLIINF